MSKREMTPLWVSRRGTFALVIRCNSYSEVNPVAKLTDAHIYCCEQAESHLTNVTPVTSQRKEICFSARKNILSPSSLLNYNHGR